MPQAQHEPETIRGLEDGLRLGCQAQAGGVASIEPSATWSWILFDAADVVLVAGGVAGGAADAACAATASRRITDEKGFDQIARGVSQVFSSGALPVIIGCDNSIGSGPCAESRRARRRRLWRHSL
jgi:hypothetical protein